MRLLFILILSMLLLPVCVAGNLQVSPKHPNLPQLVTQPLKPIVPSLIGMASFYSKQFHGQYTASGERFDKDEFTAAHPSLPFGTKVKVTNLRNQRSVVVKVNDRGGFKKHGRIIDVSRAAASELGMVRRGVARVKLEIMK